MNGDDIELFIRDKEIENTIDKKMVINSIKFDSLSLILNVLDDFICEYNLQKDEYLLNGIRRFLIKITQKFFYMHSTYYSSKENHYILLFKAYIKNICIIFEVPQHTKKDLIWHFIKSAQNAILKTGTVNEETLNIIKDEISKFNIPFNIDEKKGNIYIYLHSYKYGIYIIDNPSEYSYFIQNSYFVCMIVNKDISSISKKIDRVSNLDIVAYLNRQGFFTCLDVSTPWDWCKMKLNEVSNLIKQKNTFIEHPEVINRSIQEIFIKIDTVSSMLSWYERDESKLNQKDIKLIRQKAFALYGQFNSSYPQHRKIQLNIKSVINRLSQAYNQISNARNLDQNIAYALSEIKKNNTLYILSKSKKNLENAFGEENLTSILASNLRCLYREHRSISIDCEAMVGNGRSDIRLQINNKTLSIIEAKLIKPKSNIEQETRIAIDQLYARYGENEGIECDSRIELYLVLFAYDKCFCHMAKKIKNAVHSYAERNTLEYEKIDSTENCIRFLYKEPREEFLDKIRVINVMVCNMEIDFKSQRAQRIKDSNFDPKKRT